MNIVASKPGRFYPEKSLNRQTTPKPSKFWAKGDEGVDAFYVYILKFDDGVYYVGQTRDLRKRMIKHRDGFTVSTAGKHPKLQYFEVVPTRETAMIRESEINKIRKKNDREILRMIECFNDLIRELEFG